jgi:hypothetical protein
MTTPIRATLWLFTTALLMASSGVSAASTRQPAGAPPQYTVTAVASGHGSITPASQVVAETTTATVTVTPDAGYVLAGVDGGACGAFDNGDGTWTTDQIFADCTISASFVLSADDVVLQSDFETDVATIDDLDLGIDQAILGSSINWLTGVTCHACSEPDYHFRAAASFPVQAHVYLVFRFPINLPADSYGVVTDVEGDDALSVPLMSGDTVGPDRTFAYPVSPASTAAWRTMAGVDAYVGFRFLDTGTGRIDYGYAHLVTGASTATQPSGFPATITGYAFNRRGGAIPIP